MIVMEAFYLPYVPNDFPKLPKDYLEPRKEIFIKQLKSYNSLLAKI
jgi:hypothetical protein